MRRTKADLTAEIKAQKERIQILEVELRHAAQDLRDQKRMTTIEQTKRVSAQRGLVPYVRSLEQFDAWLLRHTSARKQVAPILKQLGLWEIKLGYDPDVDVTLSVVSVKRMQDSA